MRYTTPYYTFNFYTFVEDDLGSLAQSQVLSGMNLGVIVDVSIGDIHQGQALDAMDLTRMVGVGIDHSGQGQVLHGMGVGLELILTLMDLVQTQELEQAQIIIEGKCFCISLSAEQKIVVTVQGLTPIAMTLGTREPIALAFATRKPIAVGFQAYACGA